MAIEILIVDDNSDIRNILNELILDAGYKTRLAANYNQALKEIDKKIPDIAILDVKLDKGDNDGILLLDHIKKKNTETLKDQETINLLYYKFFFEIENDFEIGEEVAEEIKIQDLIKKHS